MKKQNIVNLIKYHFENNESGFKNEVYEIAASFNKSGDADIAQYLLSLMKDVNVLKPQDYDYSNFMFLNKDKKPCISITYPTDISDDIFSIIKSINRKAGIHRFLFVGEPGTGKTEACRHIARLSNRDLVVVKCEDLVDCRLGQTSKNVVALFEEINRLILENVIILFDEIDSLFLDRINTNDLREMGRATSSFIKQLDQLSEEAIIICTTNLGKMLDKALVRRLGAMINFDRYTTQDLCELADRYVKECELSGIALKHDSKLLHKIIKMSKEKISPSILNGQIKLATSFAKDDSYDYLRRLYKGLVSKQPIVIEDLTKKGFTQKEIGILTLTSPSSVCRQLIGGIKNGQDN